MTPDERRRAARRLAERTRAEQGLPPTVEDAAVLERVAALIECGTCRGSGWLPAGTARCPDCAP